MSALPLPPPPLLLQTLPPRRGVLWVQRAFALFLRRPMGFTLLFLSFLFVALFVMSLPLVGPIVVMMALPLLSLGFMVATRGALQGKPVHPAQYVELLRARPKSRRRRLLKLCFFYGVATALIAGLCDWVDGGRFEQLHVEMIVENGDPGALLRDAQLQFGLLLRVTLTTLLALPFWHAPALVWWAEQGTAQSLFSSWIACWRNRGALVVYGLTWMALLLGFLLLVTTVFSLLGARQLAGVAVLPAGLMFSCAFYVSLYFTFSDSFGWNEEPAGSGGAPKDQAPLDGAA
ncbi:BPSS1780 family membrane protein [Azohydromonas caseinilytica]|uniref:BPSS1780 family membrane protein n=1 Tax=Azohydromonas caseinilytica TaxID=2728836 RepID=UPI00197C14F2|nr:BPSS1780 family membrane protein [Azohydromonas caseinilytica]